MSSTSKDKPHPPADDELYPYDEEYDSVNVEKALEILHRNPNQDVAELFRDLPLRSSLHQLRTPFSANTSSAEPPGSSFRVVHPEVLQDGCYMIYDNASGGTLVLHYSKTSVPENAVGFWAPGPGQGIQDFKYATNRGYSELIRGIVGGEKNRKKYYSGWCQFIQLARQLSGRVKKISHPQQQHVKVDIYGYAKGKVWLLDMDDKLVDVSDLEAVAVVPHENDRFQGVHALTCLAFLEQGNLEGASIRLHS